MTFLLLAALHLSLFSNGGPSDYGLGLLDINGNRGTVTAARRCKSKMQPEQLRRIATAANRTNPKKWLASYSSDCLECSGFQLELGKKHVNFDEEAKLPADLDALRKAMLVELKEANKLCDLQLK